MKVGGHVAQWAQRYCLLSFLVLALLFGVTATAHAASFYWYGASPDCWQTGALGSSGEACDSGGGVISDGGPVISTSVRAETTATLITSTPRSATTRAPPGRCRSNTQARANMTARLAASSTIRRSPVKTTSLGVAGAVHRSWCSQA